MISIIIPTYNESELIGKLINFLKEFGNKDISEIIISDGGSTDNTAEIAKNAGAQVIISPQKGRAAQMNFGASMATSDILYFIHADTLPPPSFFTDI
ncbi:MAG: glycosyltransferase, partial [Ferruginibacter sp.]